MKTRFGTGTNKETGERYVYEIKRAWNIAYYSCDGGLRWFRSARDARLDATERGLLQLVGQVRVTDERGRTIRIERQAGESGAER